MKSKNISHTHLSKLAWTQLEWTLSTNMNSLTWSTAITLLQESKSITGMLSYVTPDFTALMVLEGQNKKSWELAQTAVTGCSWELQAPFRVFCFVGFFLKSLFLDTSFSLQWPFSVMTDWNPFERGPTACVFANSVSVERTCVTTDSLFKYSLNSTTGTAVGSDVHWLNGDPTQLSEHQGLLEMEI